MVATLALSPTETSALSLAEVSVSLVAYLWKSPVPNCVETPVLSPAEVSVSLVATLARSRAVVSALSRVEVSISLVAALVAYLWKIGFSHSAKKCPPERLGKPDFASLPNLSGSIRLGQMLHFRSHLYE